MLTIEEDRNYKPVVSAVVGHQGNGVVTQEFQYRVLHPEIPDLGIALG